jgi:hypothetical protein
VQVRLALMVIPMVLVVGLPPVRTVSASVVARGCPPRPPETARRITQPTWVSGAVVTEYYPVREQWFDGAAIRARGLGSAHRADWLYGPHGVAMNGEGLASNGQYYSFQGPYGIAWVNRGGSVTLACWNGTWTNGEPAWLDLGWRNRHGEVTLRACRRRMVKRRRPPLSETA